MIEKEVGVIMRSGATHLEWTTPSGFVVHQKLNKKHIEPQLQRCWSCV